MKILRLRLCNLNSLRGSNLIDFTLPPLANSGLFAITGPTGAGKTTLLDAITLALYGRVARYGTTPSPDAVMSRHTGDCSAEVEFACASGVFRSVWQLQRARKKPDGKLQMAKRRVIALPAETIVAESIKDADAKILELTGLDYDRFLRSVLLAQGDFAAFLKAGAKERTDLLQQVTGTAIYQDISQAAFRRSVDAEHAHEALLRDHQAVPVLDPAQRAAHETTLSDHTRRLTEWHASLQTLSKRIAEAQSWAQIEQATHRLEVDQTEYANARRLAFPGLTQLDHHEKAGPFVADLTSLDHLAADNAKDRSSLRQLETDLPELARHLQIAVTTAQQAQFALASQEARLVELRVLWTEVTDLDRILAGAREALRQVTEQHARFAKIADSTAASLAAQNVSLQKSAQELSVAVAWLDDHKIDAELPAQLPELQAVFTRWSSSESSAAEARRALSDRQKEVDRLERSVGTLDRKLPPLQEDLKSKVDAVEKTLRLWDTASGGLALPEIETRRDLARDRYQALEQLATDAAHLRTLALRLTVRQKEASEVASELLRSAADRQGLHTRRSDVTRLLEARRTALVFAEKVQSLEGHRAALQDNAPCPLCGAIHHPYLDAASTPSAELEAIRQKVAAAEADRENTQRQLTQAERRHASLLADQKRLTTDSAELAANHSNLKTSWNEAATLFALTDRYENEAVLSATVSEAQGEWGQRVAQVLSVRSAQQGLDEARAAHQSVQSQIERIQNEVTSQTALTTQVKGQLPALETAVEKHHRDATSEQATFTQLVSGFATSPSGLVHVSALIESLKTRGAAFTQRRAEAQSIQAEIGAQKAKTEVLTQQLASENAALALSLANVAAAKSALEIQEAVRREKFGDRSVTAAQREAEAALKHSRDQADVRRSDADKLREKQASALQEKDRLANSLTHRATDHQTIAARLRSAAAAVGFVDEGALRAALLSPKEAEVLATLRKGLEERRITLESRADALVAQRASLPPSAQEDASQLAALQAEHARGEIEQASLQGLVGEIRGTLKNDDAQRARQVAFATQIEAAHREYVRWEKLRALIGSADGSIFARFAQGLTLQRLTILANRHLTELNPRYSIRRAVDGEAGDLELEILDHYQADVARPMRSLSGGESFLASLALALGLSELASGRTSIESLFIDEGFGSLDADTLETALSALENLQAGGKTIGVISHVPAMQERIQSQIRVTKESGGCSRLSITV